MRQYNTLLCKGLVVQHGIDHPHRRFTQPAGRLTNGGQGGEAKAPKRRSSTHDGNILRHIQARFVNRLLRTDGHFVIGTKHRIGPIPNANRRSMAA
jgi:hypothetical protein